METDETTVDHAPVLLHKLLLEKNCIWRYGQLVVEWRLKFTRDMQIKLLLDVILLLNINLIEDELFFFSFGLNLDQTVRAWSRNKYLKGRIITLQKRKYYWQVFTELTETHNSQTSMDIIRKNSTAHKDCWVTYKNLEGYNFFYTKF
ncbi:hypothetical protein HZS_5490 [Henneguya salminicola]|nr:hypothetical protein HZS_5490 [Henneguya salminicola]